jgi:hypothetical protein
VRSNEKNKVILIGLLLSVFALPFIAKPSHIHFYNIDCHDSNSTHHDQDDCPICHFTLSFFTGTALQEWSYTPLFNTFEAIVFSQEKIYTSTFSSNYLRGPPLF